MNDISEEELRNLEHALLGTKKISASTSIFEEQKYIFEGVFRALRSRSGRDGRTKPRKLDGEFSNVAWSILTAQDDVWVTKAFCGILDNEVFRWQRHGRWAESIISTHYPVLEGVGAQCSISGDTYRCINSVYVKENQLDIKEGQMIIYLNAALSSARPHAMHGMFVSACYLINEEKEDAPAFPISTLNDKLLRSILPTKTHQSMLVKANQVMWEVKKKIV